MKLGANGLNALGLALIIGSLVAPIVDASRPISLMRSGSGILLGLGCVLAAMFILRYIRAQETA